MLEIKDLHVTVDGTEVLKESRSPWARARFTRSSGRTVRGARTTLLNTVIGFARYHVTQGAIYFKGRDITHATIDERARLGVGISFQRPPTIRGVTLRSLISFSRPSLTNEEIERTAERLDAREFLDREINAGLSGGEMKRTEMLQIILQSPDFVCLDEPESGVDLRTWRSNRQGGAHSSGPRQFRRRRLPFR